MKKLQTLALALCASAVLSACGDSGPRPDVVIVTDMGDIEIELYKDTPKHRENFLKLAREHFYDGTAFHRISQDLKLIQGGDPNSKNDNPDDDGSGGPGYTIPAEILPNHAHTYGALAAARLGDQQNPQKESSGSQFYIVVGKKTENAELDQIQAYLEKMRSDNFMREYFQRPKNAAFRADIERRVNEFNRTHPAVPGQAPPNPGSDPTIRAKADSFEKQAMREFHTQAAAPFTFSPEARQQYTTAGGTPFLDNEYTVFGRVTKGMDIVEKILALPTDEREHSTPQVRILEVEVEE